MVSPGSAGLSKVTGAPATFAQHSVELKAVMMIVAPVCALALIGDAIARTAAGYDSLQPDALESSGGEGAHLRVMGIDDRNQLVPDGGRCVGR